MTSTYIIILILCIAILCVVGIVVSIFFGLVLYRLNHIVGTLKDIMHNVQTEVSVQTQVISTIEKSIQLHSTEIGALWDEWFRLKMLFGMHDTETAAKEHYQAKLESLAKFKSNFTGQ